MTLCILTKSHGSNSVRAAGTYKPGKLYSAPVRNKRKSADCFAFKKTRLAQNPLNHHVATALSRYSSRLVVCDFQVCRDLSLLICDESKWLAW